MPSSEIGNPEERLSMINLTSLAGKEMDSAAAPCIWKAGWSRHVDVRKRVVEAGAEGTRSRVLSVARRRSCQSLHRRPPRGILVRERLGIGDEFWSRMADHAQY